MTLAPGQSAWTGEWLKRECHCSICMVGSTGSGHREHTLKAGCWCNTSGLNNKCGMTVMYPGIVPDNGEGAGLPRRVRSDEDPAD